METSSDGTGAASARVASCCKALEERLAAGAVEIPLLPAVATQVLSADFGREADLARLSELIHRDPALAGNLLRIANSALYGGAVRIVSLQQAVTRLGLANLREIVLSIALQGKVFQGGPFQATLQRIWTHSAASAAWAKEIARLKRRNVESAFLCGLLHDVGKPILLLALHEMKGEAGQALDPETIEAVVAQCHVRVAHTLAERWSLPEEVVSAIAQHHDPGAAQTHRGVVLITILANELAKRFLRGDAPDSTALSALEASRELDLYPEELDELLAQREKVLAFVEAMR